MLELLLVRHGQTEGNKKRLYQGWSDTRLTEKGMLQAKQLALRLRERKLDYIYSSPLGRALNTARAVNEYHNLEIITVDNIKEIHFGDWENLSAEELKELYPNYMEKWRTNCPKYSAPGGESLEEAYSRINPWFERLIKDNSEGTILIVSHAGAIRAMISNLIGRGTESHWNYIIKNCSISTINVHDGFPMLAGLNDVSHLENIKDNQKNN